MTVFNEIKDNVYWTFLLNFISIVLNSRRVDLNIYLNY